MLPGACTAGLSLARGQDGKAEEIHVGVKGLVGALYLKDLAQKTKRGQAGVVRDGRHNGVDLRAIGRSHRMAGLKSSNMRPRSSGAYSRHTLAENPRATLLLRLIPKAFRDRRADCGTHRLSLVVASAPMASWKIPCMWVGSSGIDRASSKTQRRRVSRPNPKSEWMTRGGARASHH